MSEIFETEPEYGNSAGRVNLTAYSGSKWREVKLDAMTRALNIIEYEHHEIHDGNSFHLGTVTDIAGSKSQTNLFVTCACSKLVHMVWAFISESEASVLIYEGVTVTSSGTAQTIVNRNRNSLTTSSTLSFVTSTPANTGTALLINRHWGLGRTGGETREFSEWILKTNTVYSVILTNEVATANQVTFVTDWYEHTNRDA